jgi:hypothetical protein
MRGRADRMNRRNRSMLVASLAAALAGLLFQPALASDLSWTPCHRLSIGGTLHARCEACTGQGMGWRFYVSRDSTQAQCRRDPQSKSGIYGQPRTEVDKPARKRDAGPARSAVAPAPVAPRQENRSYAPSNPSVARPASAPTASASGTKAASHGSSRPVRDPYGTARSPASHAAVPPPRTAEQKSASSSPPRQPGYAVERGREQKKSAP